MMTLAFLAKAQELSIEVTVNIPALKTADPKTLQTLEKEVSDFINQTIWTSDDYEQEEKIEGSIQINIKDDPSANTFLADIYISSGRPIYNSNYSSPLLNHVDKDVRFTYEELTPLRDSRTNFSDNLSSILTYYAMLIIGFDGDSFADLGGEPYFRTANEIVNIVPNGTDISWDRTGSDRNRYWFVQNLLDPRLRSFRKSIYQYHLRGLDKMHDDVGTGKAIILSSIKEAGQANQNYRNTVLMQMWARAKTSEILEIFKTSIKSEQREVHGIMTGINPSQGDLLKELR